MFHINTIKKNDQKTAISEYFFYFFVTFLLMFCCFSVSIRKYCFHTSFLYYFIKVLYNLFCFSVEKTNGFTSFTVSLFFCILKI